MQRNVFKDLRASLAGLLGAVFSSLCCLLPLLVVALGLGSGAFMALTMRYTPLWLSLGLLGLGTGYYLYFRERRRCDAIACQMVGGRLNLGLLILSTVVFAAAVTLTFMPATTAALIARLGGETTAGSMEAMPMGGKGAPQHPAPPAALATAILRVDGMT